MLQTITKTVCVHICDWQDFIWAYQSTMNGIHWFVLENGSVMQFGVKLGEETESVQ